MSAPSSHVAWIATHAPADAEMRRVTTETLAAHDKWDSQHYFTALAWDGARAYATLVAVLDPAIHPEVYPLVLADVMSGHLTERKREEPAADPVVACMLQWESYGLDLGPNGNLIPEESEAFARREAHTLPHRIEDVHVIAADITGRTWTASKRRGWNGPDTVHKGNMHGRFPEMLRQCAALAPPLYVAATRAFWARDSTPPA
ncbi:hypothetical protein [Nocardia sp. NPDC057455]|uniref:hypothetical protein n=1 Tax=Nocardia sp. NPDC057455 TaxID=3346138 RepID=UPI00366B0C3E